MFNDLTIALMYSRYSVLLWYIFQPITDKFVLLMNESTAVFITNFQCSLNESIIIPGLSVLDLSEGSIMSNCISISSYDIYSLYLGR